jgi:hypothetical protein
MTAKRKTMGVPYAGATTGLRAREEITRLLRGFGCEIGFADKFDEHEVLLYFKSVGGRCICGHRPRDGRGCLSRRSHGATSITARNRSGSRPRLGRGPLLLTRSSEIGKGQTTAIETGILSFEAVFMPYMLTADGRPLIERVSELLPKPDEPKVVSLPGHAGQQS